MITGWARIATAEFTPLVCRTNSVQLRLGYYSGCCKNSLPLLPEFYTAAGQISDNPAVVVVVLVVVISLIVSILS